MAGAKRQGCSAELNCPMTSELTAVGATLLQFFGVNTGQGNVFNLSVSGATLPS
jgi:hypothetical protein